MTASVRPARRTRAAAVSRWLFLPAALPVAVLSVFRAVPAEWPVLVVQLLAFTPWLAVPATAALVLAFLGRSRWQRVAVLVLIACQSFWLFPLDIRQPAAEAAGTTSTLVAMTVNAEVGGADAHEILALVRERHVDLLVVEEYTPELATRLSAAGLDGLLPHRVSHPKDGAGGSAIYSRFGLRETGALQGTQFTMPVARLDLGGAGNAALQVVAVHAVAPVGDDAVEKWRSDLRALGRIDSGAGPLLLAGDFNATYDHWEFRSLLDGTTGRRNLVDVASALGSRLVPTWPTRVYRLPGVTLDHLVTSPDIAGRDYSVHRIRGTDHAAVVATLSVRLS
jgi:endonuclease/exonuclease/phosphatase (EEP) superfamily protein YafD